MWLTLRHLGLDGHRQLIREDIELAQYAYALFKAHPAFEAGTCHLSITTFRYLPPAFRDRVLNAAEEHELNSINEALLNQIERSGRFFVSKAIVEGKFRLRLCIVNFRTSRRDMEAMPVYIQGLAEDGRTAGFQKSGSS